MKRIFAIIVILYNLLKITGQPLWDIRLNDENYYKADIAIVFLTTQDTVINRNVLESLFLNPSSSDIVYKSAIRLLIKNYAVSKDYILANLYTSRFNSKSDSMKFFYDTIIKGYFGIQQAKDTLTHLVNNKIFERERKLEAIEYLAEAKCFNYFNELMASYKNNYECVDRREIYILSKYYSKISEYKNQIIDMLNINLENNLNDIDKVRSIIADLRIVSCDEMVKSIDNILIKLIDPDIIRIIMFELESCDPINYPDKIMKIIPIISDSSERVQYYPEYLYPNIYDIVKPYPFIPRIEDNENINRKGFLIPEFVKFLLDRNDKENCNSCIENSINFLHSFKPFKPDSTHSLQYLMDDLQNYLEEVNNYRWINESSKYAEYKTQLEYAETKIANNEFEECRMKLEEYKNGIQNDFDNGLITNEAYRYLFFYPDYLIERLPDGVLSVPR